MAPALLDVVDVGYGTAGEMRGVRVEGKAVLLRMKRIFHFIQTFEKTGALEKLARRRAAAVIVINDLHDEPSGMLAVRHKDVFDRQGKHVPVYGLPCLCVGKSDGQYLLDRISSGQLKVEVHLRTSVTPARACNILGELAGRGSSEEVVLVGGHYDTWFGGALDNLASQGGILELARHFASLPAARRPRKLIFASIFGHEYGNQGHAALAGSLQELRDRITCFYDLDGSGSTGWEVDHHGRIIATGYEDVCGIVASSNALAKTAYEALYDHDVFSFHFTNNAQVADLDGPLSELGIPTLLVISKNLFYHTPLDTPDRMPPDVVYRRMEVNRQIISQLLHSPPSYFITTNTNPFRGEDPAVPGQPDLSTDALPINPRPWVEGPPKDLLFEVIPPRPRVFSPLIVWRGHFVSESIARFDDITWSFGNLMEKLLPRSRRGAAAGTFYVLPGVKTIRMTVTDRLGRQSSVERTIRVTW